MTNPIKTLLAVPKGVCKSLFAVFALALAAPLGTTDESTTVSEDDPTT